MAASSVVPYTRTPPTNRDEERTMFLREHFASTIVRLGKKASFNANVIGCRNDHVLYRNGIRIKNSFRKKKTYKGQNHQLLIKRVKKKDEGVYLLTCTNEETKEIICTSASLHIAVGTKRAEAPRCTIDQPYSERFRVLKHLVSPNFLREGDTLILNAEFSECGHIFLFQNNRLIWEIEEENTLEWHIPSCTMHSSGLYTCLMHNSKGMLATHAKVAVLPKAIKTVKPKWKYILPKIQTVFSGQPIYMLSRCIFEENTNLEWTHNDRKLSNDSKVSMRDLGGGYVMLNVRNTNMTDAGVYTLRLSNAKNKTLFTTNCVVKVMEPGCVESDIVMRAPTPMIVHAGSSCVLSAEFHVEDLWNYYVVWRIGQCVIKADTQHCTLHWMMDTHIIAIKNISPEMNGIVVCELHPLDPAVPKQVLAVESYLTVVPDAVDEKFCKNWKLQWENGDAIFPEKLKHPTLIGLKPEYCVTECYNERFKERNTALVLYFIRLDDKFFYLKIIHSDLFSYDDISLKYKTEEKNLREVGFLKVSWDITDFRTHYVMDTTNETELNQVKWRSTGTMSRRPSFRIENLALRKFFLCRVLSAVPREHDIHLMVDNLVISIPEERCEDSCMQGLSREDYCSQFEVVNPREIVGQGGFGKIKIIQRLTDKKLFVQKEFLDYTESVGQLINEITIYKIIKHPNIGPAIYHVIEDPILILEYLQGKNLYENLKNSYVTEYEAQQYMRQICEAIQFLHNKNIVHSDIKPSNIMKVHPNSNAVRLVDFGGSVFAKKGYAKQRSGSEGYLCPEAFLRVGPPNDMWSVGVTTYRLLSSPDRPKIDEVEYGRTPSKLFDSSRYNEISENAKDFVQKLLVNSIRRRMTANEALAHEWLSGIPTSTSSDSQRRNRLQTLKNLVICWDSASGTNQQTGDDFLSSCGESICLQWQLCQRNVRIRRNLRARAARELDLEECSATNKTQRAILEKYIPRPTTPASEEYTTREEVIRDRVKIETYYLNPTEAGSSTSLEEIDETEMILKKCTVVRPRNNQGYINFIKEDRERRKLKPIHVDE